MNSYKINRSVTNCAFCGLVLSLGVVLGVTFSAVFILPVSALAEETPSEVLRSVYTKLKQDGNAAVVAQYIDWDTEFASLDEEKRKMMGVASAKEMQSYYEKVLSDPLTYLRANMMPFIDQLPEDKKESTKAEIEQVLAETEVKLTEDRKALKELKFEIGEEKIENDKATVSVTTTVKGTTKTQSITLTKVNGRWLLPSSQGLAPGVDSDAAAIP